jgi:HEAT repeat protein
VRRFSILLFCLPLVAQAQAPQNKWTQLLDRQADWPLIERVASIRKIARSDGTDALETLIGALSDPSSDVLRPAVLALGRRRSPETFQAIVDLIPTQRNKGSWESAYELFRYPYEPYRELFYRNWDHQNSSVRGVITCALGMHGRPEEYWRLVRRMDDPMWNVVWEAVYNLHRYRDLKYQRAMVALIHHPKHKLQAGAIMVLGLQGSKIARWPIARRMNDPSEEIRRLAADSVRRIDSANP